MFHPRKTFAVGLAVLMSLGAANAARAQTIPLKASGVGQVLVQIDPTPDTPGVQVYEVRGVSTLAGRTTGSGTTFFTLDGLVEGTFVAVSADGETITGSYAGTWAPIPDTSLFRFDVETDWADGTGRFEGVTGQSSTVAVLDGLTGAFDWAHDGEWVLP
jgi:hypothetical protein